MDRTFHNKPTTKTISYLRFLPVHLRKMGLTAITLGFLNVLSCTIAYFFLQPQIPLFYSQANDQQLADKIWIFLIPGLALLSNMLHFTFMKTQREINEQILKMLVQLTVLLQILLLAISWRIIIIVN